MSNPTESAPVLLTRTEALALDAGSAAAAKAINDAAMVAELAVANVVRMMRDVGCKDRDLRATLRAIEAQLAGIDARGL